MDIDQTQLKASEVHFGSSVQKWNPHMKSYVYKKSKKVYILDWRKIISSCKKADEYIKELLAKRKSILFLSTKKTSREVVKEQAISCGMPYIINKWKGGFLTNFFEIKKKLKELHELTSFIQKDSFQQLNKKEQVTIQKRRNKLHNIYEGVIDLKRQPGALFIIGLEQERTALKEAQKVGIPIIGVCNTHCNPHSVDYVLPGNDDKLESSRFFASVVANAIKKVQEKNSFEFREKQVSVGA
jgi:small subunit ribosomal protein S2